MIRFAVILLAGMLLLPFTVTPAAAKATSSAPQVHVVKQGDSLYEIGRKYGLSVRELKRLNGLSSNRLKLGQKLALTKAAAPPMPQTAKARPRKGGPAVATSGKAVHTVRKGDSLHSIARRHGTTVEQLRQFNGLSSNRLKIGQKLALSAGDVDREAIDTPAPVREPGTRRAAAEQHVVKKGETLASIARRHHMSVKELKRLNGLRSTRLKIGQRLALADPYEERNPVLLPGDSSDDEVIQMADSSDSELEKVAFNYLSIPYRFGGNSRRGIDCSAFVQQVFREMDVQLPRSAREQFRVGEKIDRDEMKKGDLIFFRTYARFPSHVGIYLGDGKMIHASSRSRRVVVTSIDHPYYRKRFIGAKRIGLLDATALPDAQGVPVEEAGEDLAAPPVETAPAIVVGDSGTPTQSEPSGTISASAAAMAAPATDSEPVAVRQAADFMPSSTPPIR